MAAPSEKRAFVRLSKGVTVYYKVIKNPGSSAEVANAPEVRVSTKDISAGGLAFYSKETVPALSIVEVRIKLSDGDTPVVCLAEVVRSRRVENTPFCDTALFFLDLSNHDRLVLDRFVHKEMR